ncbi:MAG: glutathione S-transferase C-terminal domain-containing protein [Pseudomonadaceae bacterium]|nr:glutathione S-transferase C-terminal domain-containing protein [Pseudomonadaceae bacterium]
MKVYGASVSYYTGKLEAYLRYKGIAYERDVPYERAAEIKAAVGCIQHPMVECDDGRWMSDSTPMLLHFESEHPGRSILPDNPVVHFVAMLIEDYADEWLWRAAMHYRWSYEHDSALLSRILADELTSHLKAPRFLRVRTIKKRQLTGFVVNDGVTSQTREHVELGYRRILALMSESLRERPFLLGDSPSIADFGLMGPMLRHFGQDPTPAEIMRDTAPLVFEWLGRMWNVGSKDEGAGFLEQVPDDLSALLQEVCETHLVQLDANAVAYHAGVGKFSMTVQDCNYTALPVSRYRVYCLEMLRERFANLSESDQLSVKHLLPFEDAQTLWSDRVRAESEYDVQRLAPFNTAINVFDNGVPA